MAQDLKGAGERLLSLIKLLAEMESPFRVSRVAEQLQLSPSTVHRMLRVLRQEGMLEEGPGRSYVLGPELYRVSALIMGKYDLVRVARSFARDVVASCDEVCFFCQYLPGRYQIAPIVAEYGKNPLRYTIDLLVPMTAAWGASGIAIVAFLPPQERRAVWSEMERSPATGKPRPKLEAFEAELANIREAGFANTRSQKMPGAVGFAAPVFGAAETPVGSLCVTVPELRFEAEMIEAIGSLLVDRAARMSASLGARGVEGSERVAATRR